MDPGKFKVECILRNLWKNEVFQWPFFHAAPGNGIARCPRKKHSLSNATRVSIHRKIGEQRHHKPGDKFTDATTVFTEQKCLYRDPLKTSFGTVKISLKKGGIIEHSFSPKSGSLGTGTIPIKIRGIILYPTSIDPKKPRP